ncbi:MAG: NAD-dependent DNA ligase LigA [Defluviitaleaceae bacterium]|nr:NAD-dependent DNA ligase LigA [Defluviitaleaceae bacterium]
MIGRIKELSAQLNAANRAYYHENREIISNLEYDNLYDELVRLEAETGIQLAGSPTRKVGYEVVGSLQKAPHDTPMLSLDKTKDPAALIAFLGEHEGLLSWKLDGLTIVLRYNNGELVRALTRGNGSIGEDVTHNARVFTNIPLTVPHKGRFDIRGEAVISIADFNEINKSGEYKNPRNLCSGAVRQLNNEVTAQRRVKFFAFSIKDEFSGLRPEPHELFEKSSTKTQETAFHAVSDDNFFEGGSGETFFLKKVSPESLGKKSEQLKWLAAQGFEVAEYEQVTAENVVEAVARFKSKISSAELMSDGLVLTYDDVSYSRSLGATSKFPRDSLAFKWADEIAETTLADIEWSTSRTGLVNPVAVFEPVEIEGTVVSRASLHNVSILRGLGLKKGDRISVYKANMIIPQVAENLSGGAADEPPEVCPVCGGATEITGSEPDKRAASPEVLYCTNAGCPAQLVGGLAHFVSRDAMNIAGLSEQTLEKFASRGFVTNFLDLFELERHRDEILQTEGFGEKSYEKLLRSIEAAKDVRLPNFIYALGIRHVGLANAKLLCAHFGHDAKKIADVCAGEDSELAEIKGFGEAISRSLHEYFSHPENRRQFDRVSEILRIPSPTAAAGENRPLAGLTFVITGDVTRFKNRKELQGFIENAGGRVTGSVTAKTSFLINNDAKSASAKNKKAAALDVPVIDEDEFAARFA